MKALSTNNGVFGPFSSIVDSGNVWACDETIYPKDVVGTAAVVDWVAPPVFKTIEQLKTERQAAVDAITVTVDGLTFDGDETSQTRMARALVVMQAASIPTISWVLHDNTVATVSVTQLTQALAAAGAEQARLWVAPYEAVSA